MARYCREQNPSKRGSDRCWTTQAAATENLDHHCRGAAVAFGLEDSLDLSLGTLVSVTRIFGDLLVRLKSQDRALRRLCHSYCSITERHVSAVSKTLRRVRL